MLALPPGYSVRPMRLDDVPAIVAMLNVEAEQMTGEPQFVVEDYVIDLQEPGFELERQTRIVHTADGRVAAVAEIHGHAPYVRMTAWVRVAPEHGGQGLGNALLRWCEEEAQTRIPLAPDGARVALQAHALGANEAARALLATAGYGHVRNFNSLRIELPEAPPPPRWPEGIRVRTWEPDIDARVVYAAVDESFSDHWGHVSPGDDSAFERWLHNKLNDPTHDPTLQFLALDGDEIAGVCLCMSPLEPPFHFGWVEQLGVRRPWRQRGLAQALLLHSFGEYYRRGTHKVGLGVDADSLTGATRLYEKVGMYVHYFNAVFEKELRAGVELSTRTLDAQETP